MTGTGPDEELWARLGSAGDRAGIADAWLSLQAAQLGTVVIGVVVMRPQADAESFNRLAVWPVDAQADEALQSIAERCVEQRRGQVVLGDGTMDLAYPLVRDSRLEGVIALRCTGNEPERVFGALQLGVGWLVARLILEELTEDSQRRDQLDQVVGAVETIQNADHYVDSSMLLATRLASSLSCDRVSIGYFVGGDSRLAAVSHLAIAPENMNLLRSIEGLMDEAADQTASLSLPGPETVPPRVLLQHQRHIKEHGIAAILTVPVRTVDDEVVAIICLERGQGQGFSDEDRELVDAVAQTAGPMLELRRRDELWIGAKMIAAARRQLSRLIGPAYLGRKIVALLLGLLLVFSYTAYGAFRVTADSRLEGSVRRVIAAPLDGFLLEAPARAGDTVAEGDLIAQLDDRDLRLEQISLASERTQTERQLQDARARGERAQASVLAARLDQLDAQLNLAEVQIERMRITAPFSGVLITGDLSQSLGGAVSRGEGLFELAPLGGYRVILQLDEADIDHIAVGMSGELTLASLPGRRFAFEVERLTSVTVAQEGVNRFEVQALLTTDDERLRPGMEGVAKVDVGERRLVWIWNRRMIDWVRLTLWRYGP